MCNKNKNVLFGAAFYDEYLPSSDLEHDFSLMQEAGFSVIRVGEGSWSKWEPEDGSFNMDWLEPVLDKACEKGISAIIGMPTFSLPRWMARKYPELAITEISGMPKKFGYREEHNYSHPAYRYYSQRIAEKIVMRYRAHPAVIGWQVYNEPGLFINYSKDCFEGFKDFLRHKYGTVENLNKLWGLVFWSHELSTWDDLWVPEGNGSPQYDFEWRNYQQVLTTELVSWTREQVRRYALPDQFTTACIATSRRAVDEGLVSQSLEVASANIYYQMQDGFLAEGNSHMQATAFASGAWTLSYCADRGYAMKQAPFYVFETNAGPIGGAADNYPAWNGQWRQAAYQMIARGAAMIEYWHWQALHYGTETWWGGVLPHDRKPGRVFAQIAALGKEITDLDDEFSGLQPEHDMVFLYSERSRNALAVQPHRALDATSPHRQLNEQSYDEILQAFYQGAYDSNRQVSIIHDTQLVNDSGDEWLISPATFAKSHSVLVVAALFCSSTQMRAWLNEYVLEGGHLILGPKSLYASETACPLIASKPALDPDLTGCFYQEYSSLDRPLRIRTGMNFLTSDSASAIDWLECLVPTQGEILARVDHPHFSQYAAIVTHSTGIGRVTTVGVIPDRRLAADLFRWAVKKPLAPEFSEPGITACTAINGFGNRIIFVFNWGWETRTVSVPVGFVRIDNSNPKQPTGTELKAWDVQIFRAGERANG